MEKRIFLAIFLSFVVLAGYQAFFAPPVPVPSPASPAPPTETQASAAAAAVPSAPSAPAAAPLVADTVARDVIVETDSIRAVFSTVGATLKSWKLKQHLEAGQPLELIPAEIPDSFPRP